MLMANGWSVTGVVAGALGSLCMARRFFGSNTVHMSRSHSLSPSAQGGRGEDGGSEGAATLAPSFCSSPWPQKISQFNPFRKQGYEVVAESGDGDLL
jgi:hypothetical protein